MLMHQGIGLDAFNDMPTRRAVHALYECCNSVAMAGDLAKGRPYPDRGSLFRRADTLLFALPENSIDGILQSYPKVGSRPGSVRSQSEHCAVWDERPGVMGLLDSSARSYAGKFGFEFVMHVGPDCPVSAVVAAIADRMHNDAETERKVLRNEIAKLNRSRLERMLGPAGGYDNWA
ncbi:MAG: 2-oxo-4-hydroxy-4-carboxy-5-ureidoimidazoline decarboxylase [Mycobacterium sp.]